MGVGIPDLRMVNVGEGIGVDQAVPSTSMRDSSIVLSTAAVEHFADYSPTIITTVTAHENPRKISLSK
jgi:hypothetical protein